MPPQNISVKGVIAGLNQAESLKQLQEDLNNIQDKLKLTLSNIGINDSSVSALKEIADKLDQVSKSGQNASEMINGIDSAIDKAKQQAQNTDQVINGLVKSFEKVGDSLKMVMGNGEVWVETEDNIKKVQDQIFSATDAINRFKTALGTGMKDFSVSYLDEGRSKIKGMQATIESMNNGVMQRSVITGDKNGSIVAPTDTEQIAKTQEALQKAKDMMNQYGEILNQLRENGVLTEDTISNLSSLLDDQFVKISTGAEKSMSTVKQAFGDAISSEKALIAQVEKGNATLSGLMDKIGTLRGSQFVDSNKINSMESIGNSLVDSGDINAIKELQAEYQKYIDTLKMGDIQQKAIDENIQRDAKIAQDAAKQIQQADTMLSSVMAKISDLNNNRFASTNKVNSMLSTGNSLVNSGDISAIKELETEYTKYIDLLKMDGLQEKAKAENDQKDFAAQQKAIKDEEALRKQDLADFQNSINEKIKVIKTLQQTQVISAQQALNLFRNLYTQNVDDVRLSANQQLDIVKAMYAQEENIAKQSAEKQAQAQKGAFSPMNHTGFGMGPLGMAGTMVSFEASLAVLDNFKQGLVDVGQGAAGIQQVFQNQIQTQQQLNQVTNQFIAIAQKYGVSITDVTNAAKLWGRQYKDVNEALMLTNNSTLLSIVDNLDVSNANRAVESSINAMTKEFNNYGSAVAMSTKLVDSWSAVSHEASVSASDLTQGFERSAAAANVAGLNIDQLNSLIAASVRNTGRSGATMGWSILAA